MAHPCHLQKLHFDLLFLNGDMENALAIPRRCWQIVTSMIDPGMVPVSK
jgi:hypothetical protein